MRRARSSRPKRTRAQSRLAATPNPCRSTSNIPSRSGPESGLEMPALRLVLGSALQPLDKGVQDHGPPPELEAHMQPASSTEGKRQYFATDPASARNIVAH